MQSREGESLLHSCFNSLKIAVMGCCYSLCHKETDQQENIINERTHLLEVAEQQQEATVPAVSATTPPRKPDEQNALNKILHETANNVIDVGLLVGYGLESGAYSERVRAYTARLGSAVVNPTQSAPTRSKLYLLRDVTQAERTAAMTGKGLAGEDKLLITNALKKAAAAISELRVEHHEDLVVPFRVP